jgi:hypothetical protein
MYEKAMEHLQASYPDDREAAIFYALAVRGNASPSDKTYANQKNWRNISMAGSATGTQDEGQLPSSCELLLVTLCIARDERRAVLTPTPPAHIRNRFTPAFRCELALKQSISISRVCRVAYLIGDKLRRSELSRMQNRLSRNHWNRNENSAEKYGLFLPGHKTSITGPSFFLFCVDDSRRIAP